MDCFGTTDFDNSSRLITLSAIIISGFHCTMNVAVVLICRLTLQCRPLYVVLTSVSSHAPVLYTLYNWSAAMEHI